MCRKLNIVMQVNICLKISEAAPKTLNPLAILSHVQTRLERQVGNNTASPILLNYVVSGNKTQILLLQSFLFLLNISSVTL